MGRPKKSELGPIPTQKRIMDRATELFAQRGYDAVSVRDITKSLGLNEASLYNHFKNKEDLFAAILEQLHRQLIKPGFSPLPPELFNKEGPFDVTQFLLSGARTFFSKADHNLRLTWRILMISQYRYEAAHRNVQANLLDAPCYFFKKILQAMKDAKKIRQDTDCTCVGRIIAALFFDFSFRANLNAAWDMDEEAEGFRRLEMDLEFISRGLKPEE